MNKIAFEELYMQQLPGLFRLAQSILRQPADAEDAVQQAVLQAWQQIDAIQHGKEKAYLARIVINECHNDPFKSILNEIVYVWWLVFL